MIFRSLAALVFCAGGTVLIAALSLLGDAPGVTAAARHLREMKWRTGIAEHATPFTLADFAALPQERPLEAYAPLERRAVSLEGWVQRVLVAGDGDLHLEIVVTPRVSGGPDTVYVTGEVTPAFRRTDAWRVEQLAAVLRPNEGCPTRWDSGPQKVRVTGWLLYDFQYDQPVPPWSPRPGGRLTGWEIHPVTGLERWSARSHAWIEVPR